VGTLFHGQYECVCVGRRKSGTKSTRFGFRPRRHLSGKSKSWRIWRSVSRCPTCSDFASRTREFAPCLPGNSASSGFRRGANWLFLCDLAQLPGNKSDSSDCTGLRPSNSAIFKIISIQGSGAIVRRKDFLAWDRFAGEIPLCARRQRVRRKPFGFATLRRSKYG
jgi:hypothetical protein